MKLLTVPFRHVALDLVVVGLLFALPARSASPETPWDALRHLSKRHTYTVLNRDGSCLSGTFVSVSEKALVLEQDGEYQIPRAGILRISAGEKPDIHTTLYSGRSSWADLQALHSPPYYSSLLVVTADARQFTGSLLGVANDQLALLVEGKEMRFAKEYVARVLLTGKDPAFGQSERHRSILDISKKFSAPMQPVPLYETNSPEENERLDCTQVYRRPQ